MKFVKHNFAIIFLLFVIVIVSLCHVIFNFSPLEYALSFFDEKTQILLTGIAIGLGIMIAVLIIWRILAIIISTFKRK